MFLHCRYINTRAQASASWFDNAQEGKKRTIARKHGHLRVLLLSASESGRRFGAAFHHHFSKPTALGWLCHFLLSPAPRRAWAKSACATSSVACRNSPRFRLVSILFCSLFSNKSAERLSVGTRRTPLLSGTYTCVEKMRFSTWSGRQPCATHVGDQPFGGMNSNSLRCASQSSGTSACRPRIACKFRWRG